MALSFCVCSSCLSDSALHPGSTHRLPHVVAQLKNQQEPFDQARETNWQSSAEMSRGFISPAQQIIYSVNFHVAV
jgi:hypothetical protein